MRLNGKNAVDHYSCGVVDSCKAMLISSWQTDLNRMITFKFLNNLIYYSLGSPLKDLALVNDRCLD